MKRTGRIALAVLTSFSIGVVGGRAIHARQTKAPPANLISEADAVTDFTAIEKSGEKGGDTLPPSAASAIAAGGNTPSLEGE